MQYFDGKIDWGLPHQVVAIEGTNDLQDVGKTFRIAEGCSEFRVVMQLSHCSGEFFLKDLTLYQVKETNLYKFKTPYLRENKQTPFPLIYSVFAPSS